MRGVRGVALALLLLPLGGMLAGCDSLDTFALFDTKKKLPGERHPVFPNGVPGVTQGIPPDLVKGYQEQPSPDPAAAAAAATAEKIEPPKPQPKPKPKPKPRTAAAPQPPQQAQAPSNQQPAPQPAAQPAPAPWPSQPAQQGAGWPQPR
jgi:outer membrane biosynthesis protein TonB